MHRPSSAKSRPCPNAVREFWPRAPPSSAHVRRRFLRIPFGDLALRKIHAHIDGARFVGVKINHWRLHPLPADEPGLEGQRWFHPDARVVTPASAGCQFVNPRGPAARSALRRGRIYRVRARVAPVSPVSCACVTRARSRRCCQNSALVAPFSMPPLLSRLARHSVMVFSR